MSTTQARTRATAAWRARKALETLQVQVPADILVKLDALVQARGVTGRAALLAELIHAAHEVLDCPARPVPQVPEVSAPAGLKRWD